MTDGSGTEAALHAALSEIRARGVIGTSVDDAVRHADQFVAAIPDDVRTVADLGAGGGLPGLVVAVRRPSLSITLIERRRTRADLLERAVRRLGLGARVVVVGDDVRAVATRSPHCFDAVTARSFGGPAVTMRWAAQLLRNGGVLVVSEPPSEHPDRWPAPLCAQWSMHDDGRYQGVRRFRFHVEQP